MRPTDTLSIETLRQLKACQAGTAEFEAKFPGGSARLSEVIEVASLDHKAWCVSLLDNGHTILVRLLARLATPTEYRDIHDRFRSTTKDLSTRSLSALVTAVAKRHPVEFEVELSRELRD